jgi:hypothetical protein
VFPVHAWDTQLVKETGVFPGGLVVVALVVVALVVVLVVRLWNR